LELHRLLKPITIDRMPLAKKPDCKNKIDHWTAPKYWAAVDTATSPQTDCYGTQPFAGCTRNRNRKSPSSLSLRRTEAIPAPGKQRPRIEVTCTNDVEKRGGLSFDTRPHALAGQHIAGASRQCCPPR
jgi:hypothetical protein